MKTARSALAQLDHRYVWHPFTQMRDWLRAEPIVIVDGQGSVLRDERGREYLDANSSIWTNLHGHSHPKINSAIRLQLRKIAHSSTLGFANEPASLLARKLVESVRRNAPAKQLALAKVFFSDDGSTAMEVALKLAYQYAIRTGRSRRPEFLSLDSGYHGDTVGAVSLGHIDLFHQSYGGLVFKTDKVMSPYCYRCPFNRAKPQRADAREYRKCQWECVGKVEQKFGTRKKRPYAAFVFEPLLQGAAGMIPQPDGWLGQVAKIARGHGAPLIADEVMTGLGRVASHGPGWLACHQEKVQPDFAALAKGLTGGYLPMAATLTTEAVFEAFLGEYEDFKTFFHGHSFTGNQLGAAAALASMDLLDSRSSQAARLVLAETMRRELQSLWPLAAVGDIRQVGVATGIELVKHWKTRETFPLREQAGIRVCGAMARRGVLTRPVGNVIVLMPPFCTTPIQVRTMVRALRESIIEVHGACSV